MTMQSQVDHFDAETATIGHNSGDVRYSIEVRMFNRIPRQLGIRCTDCVMKIHLLPS